MIIIEMHGCHLFNKCWNLLWRRFLRESPPPRLVFILSKVGKILNARFTRSFLRSAFIPTPFATERASLVFARLLSAILLRGNEEGDGHRKGRVFRIAANGRESFYESFPVFVFTREKRRSRSCRKAWLARHGDAIEIRQPLSAAVNTRII